MSTTAPLAQRVKDALANNPKVMTMQLARELGAPEGEVVRSLPDDRAVELDLSRWEELFNRLATLGKVHVIVTNGAATLEVEGEFGGFSTWGEFFNVQNGPGGLDMHIRYGELGSVFAVEKPSHLTGINTLSLQLFDRRGAAALKVFFNFGGKPSPQRLAQFEAIREQFRKS
jgi:putative heme utilization carrier protein HutX